VAVPGNADAAAPATPPRIAILPILSVNFIGTLGDSIVMPLMIFLVTKFGGNGLVFGIIGATY
jgi:hypothetical protein